MRKCLATLAIGLFFHTAAAAPFPYSLLPDHYLSDQHFRLAQALSQSGDRQQAANGWQALAQSPALTVTRLAAYLKLIELYQAKAQTQKLITALQSAIKLNVNANAALQAYLQGKLGAQWLAQHDFENAEQTLQSGLAQAKLADHYALAALILNDLGRLSRQRHQTHAAELYFAQAASFARASSQHHTWLTALHNQLVLDRNRENDDAEQRRHLYDDALLAWNRLMDPDKTALAIGFASLAIKDMERGNKFATIAIDFLHAAMHGAPDAISQSQIHGLLGSISLRRRQWANAESLTMQAVVGAEKQQHLAQLYRWYWQMAEIKHRQSDDNQALRYFQLAVATHQRMFIANHGDGNGEQKLYQSYLRLLLNQADQSPSQSKFDTVIGVVEKLRTAAIQNYFRDQCIADSRIDGQNPRRRIGKHTALLYPLVLDDQLHLLLAGNDKIIHVKQAFDSQAFKTRTERFRNQLETLEDDGYLANAKVLYKILIAPIANRLKKNAIHQLIVIPDSYTAAIPYAALHDGERFVAEFLSVSIAPSIELTPSHAIGKASKALYAGVSLPVGGLPALQKVNLEIQSSKRSIPGDILLNRRFVTKDIVQRIRHGSYNVLHIASHAQISDDFNASYIMAFDGKIHLDALQNLVSSVRFSRTPIDLLTLSACSTAIGTGSAGLGFAGLAVKSGARSTLASLWAIDDDATAHLISEFYKKLVDNQHKSQSLRLAQLDMLKRPAYSHPGHWAAFVLVGDWN